MKKQIALIMLCMFSCLASISHGQNKALQIAPMRLSQPFPYSVGVAVSLGSYEDIRASLEAADGLRTAARAAVDSLTKLKEKYSAQGKTLDSLTLADALQLGQLTADKATLQQQLNQANTGANAATTALLQIRASLPRRTVKKLPVTASPQDLANAVDARIDQLEKQRYRYGGLGVALGLFTTLFLFLR